jgi:hypothetical protein
MTTTTLLARIVAESAAGLALWERWRPEIFLELPPWAREFTNASITVRAVLVVPDEIEREQVIVLNHADGTVERRLVHERRLVGGRDEGGWVARATLGGDPQTNEGRACIAALRKLERLGLAERDSRHWWRPTAAGLEVARQQTERAA